MSPNWGNGTIVWFFVGGRRIISPEFLYHSDCMFWASSPHPFWHQGPVSWKTIFPWAVGGWFRDDSSTLRSSSPPTVRPQELVYTCACPFYIGTCPFYIGACTRVYIEYQMLHIGSLSVCHLTLLNFASMLQLYKFQLPNRPWLVPVLRLEVGDPCCKPSFRKAITLIILPSPPTKYTLPLRTSLRSYGLAELIPRENLSLSPPHDYYCGVIVWRAVDSEPKNLVPVLVLLLTELCDLQLVACPSFFQ